MDDTIAAIATPLGEGGIHIVRISGKNAWPIASKLFRAAPPQATDSIPPLKATFGHIVDPETQRVLDEVLLIRFEAPRSYTCEDVVEIHGHGGAFVAARILQSVLDAGARLAQPGEFTRRAFLNGRLDLTQAEAVADLIHAASDKALASAVSQLQGKLSETLNGLYDRLLAVLSQLEAAIDFPEEGLEFERKQAMAGQVRAVQKEIDQLIATFRAGRIYREGWNVALVGKPNVGKSSLLNALLKEDRAIVTPHPGTTRDVLEERVRIRDLHLNIVDTAGIRHQPEEIEEEGIRRTRRALEKADLALVVLDASSPLDGNDTLLLDEVKGKPCFLLLNKSDRPAQLDIQTLAQKFPGEAPLNISATTGAGLDTLVDRLYTRMLEGVPSGEGAVITRERHRAALANATEALANVVNSLDGDLSEDLVAVDLNTALEHLGGLLGKTFVEDLLDQIFDDFCIGK
ncbi:tRNA modification GTPase [Nitrospina gracilis 3/211]|uniref:tRNA modification GTPase MnmE n=1 Tax=Nitrospina gracilis (strain 3/211) TaxID=1266370 RepID=M1YWZ6_NITG3|nr:MULTISPECIES: tRNA uridine-5-carboxymethylaminomethyl(34) synthesis GTPase MnmE [Nitrospina]MCF8722405.1 tRNA modification GTPase [Nitrospina sp. Nb-3]CCQ90019.1 tRNA modification GTPase [Nitrospina gracilis 3/211]